MTGASAVVCAYTEERWGRLWEAVGSLQDQTRPPKEIVVVVDHNETLLARARRAFGDHRVVPNRGRRGLSDARNTGLATVRSEAVAFLDDDAVAEPLLLEKLTEVLSDEGVMAAGGSALPDWETGRPGWFPDEFDWVVGCSYRGLPTETAPVRNLLGCNMAFRREVFDRVGGFRSDMGRIGNIPLGCEETDLCLRTGAEYGPGAVVYRPDAVVRHLVGADRCRWGYLLRRCYSEGLSKALIARTHKTNALSTEWRYVTRILSAGIGRHLAGETGGRAAGAARAGTILAGLAATGSGYLTGRMRPSADSSPSSPVWETAELGWETP